MMWAFVRLVIFAGTAVGGLAFIGCLYWLALAFRSPRWCLVALRVAMSFYAAAVGTLAFFAVRLQIKIRTANQKGATRGIDRNEIS